MAVLFWDPGIPVVFGHINKARDAEMTRTWPRSAAIRKLQRKHLVFVLMHCLSASYYVALIAAKHYEQHIYSLVQSSSNYTKLVFKLLKLYCII